MTMWINIIKIVELKKKPKQNNKKPTKTQETKYLLVNAVKYV